MQEQIFDLLMKDDEITWQTIILELIKTEQMNPWDIDITILCNRYIETVRALKEQNFIVSGKVILAAALLLRIKSSRLLEEDLAEFDHLLFPPEVEDFDAFLEPEQKHRINDVPRLAIKTPQSRKRKVSLKDLIGALQKVLETNRRKIRQRLEEAQYYHPEMPAKKVDITQLINNLYERIIKHFEDKEHVMFSTLIPTTPSREDKVYTFVPLLHLSNQGRVNLLQEQAFSDITIKKYSPEEIQQ